MLEKEMEDLIAEHPDSFFPRNKFTLIGRQGSFAGVGRYDLLFKDEYDYNILLELKAVPAKYQDAHQLAKYKDAFTERGVDKILLWLVATHIPKSVRDFLENVGIEYTEIHEIEFRKVASLFKYIFKSEEPSGADISILSSANYNVNINHNNISIKSSKYEEKKAQLKNTFLTAYNFLSYIDNNHGTGFKFGKSVNVHLYYHDGFYAYIKLNHSSLSFSPFPNLKIKGDKKNNARLLFDKPLISLIESLNGFKDNWAIRNVNEFEIRRNTPEEFFEKLLQLIKNVHK
jgi:hypothetical protein